MGYHQKYDTRTDNPTAIVGNINDFSTKNEISNGDVFFVSVSIITIIIIILLYCILH